MHTCRRLPRVGGQPGETFRSQRYQNKTISGETERLNLEPSTLEEQRPLRGLRDKLNGGRKLLWSAQQGLTAN